MRRLLLLFDVDGTLLLTGGASSRAIQTACRALWGDRFKWVDVLAGNLDPDIFRELAAHSGIADADAQLPAYQKIYLQALQTELAAGALNVRVLPGIKTLLASLSQRREIVLGLLTGNYHRATDFKLQAAGLDRALFKIGAFGEDASTRPQLVAAARRQYEHYYGSPCPPRQILIIGDTPRDVDAARRSGCCVAAIATGRYSVNQLASLRPDLLLSDLSDPRPFHALLDQMLK